MIYRAAKKESLQYAHISAGEKAPHNFLDPFWGRVFTSKHAFTFFSSYFGHKIYELSIIFPCAKHQEAGVAPGKVTGACTTNAC